MGWGIGLIQDGPECSTCSFKHRPGLRLDCSISCQTNKATKDQLIGYYTPDPEFEPSRPSGPCSNLNC